MRRPVGATIEISGERNRDKKGGRGAGRRCAGASLMDGVPPFAVKQPQTGTSRRAEGAGESTDAEAEASGSRASQ